MELLALGVDGMYASPGGATSGYLVRSDGFALWMDLGSGTLANLQEHVSFLDVDAVVISHRHPDHFVDLFGLFIARLYGTSEPPAPVPLFAPPDALERAHGLVAGGGEAGLQRTFDVREVEPGTEFEVGPFRIRTAPMAHPVVTLALRIEADGTSLVYSADTGPTRDLVRLAQGADLLLAEATWQDEAVEYPPDLHLTASQAGEHAREAAVRTLMLTHLKPGLDPGRSREEAAGTFQGEVLVAERDMTMEIRR